MGKEKIVVDNGHSLSNSHIGSSMIPSSVKPLLLNNILYAPQITKNLLSVSQIIHDNDVFAEFYSDYCMFKDKTTKKVLLRGTLREGLYELDISKLQDGFKLGDVAYTASLYDTSNKTCSLLDVSLISDVVDTSNSASSCNQSTNAKNKCTYDSNSIVTCKPANLWHSCLGHPSKKVLNDVLSSLNINGNFDVEFCSYCQFGNSHKQPFSSAKLHTSSILELVHADVWDPSPIVSIEGYRYYICFIDDFTCFS